MKKHKRNGVRSSHKIYEKFVKVFVKYPEGKIQEHIKKLHYERFNPLTLILLMWKIW